MAPNNLAVLAQKMQHTVTDMPAIGWVAAVFASFFIYLLGAIVHYRFLHPLSKYPGPFWASITNLWKFRECYTMDLPNRMCRYHEKYGEVIRIGPNDLAFNSPDAINPIYKAGRKMPKGVFYKAFSSLVPEIFSTRDETFHALRARQIGQGFSVSSLKNMEPMFDRHIDYLLTNLDRHSADGTAIDLKQALAFYGYDITGQLAFDTDFQTQLNEDPSRLPPLNDHFFLGNLYGCVADLLPTFATITAWHPWVAGLIKSRHELIALADSCVKQGIDNKKDKSNAGTLLEALITAKDPETGKELSKDEITSESFLFLVAGAHTTSSSLMVLFWYIFKNPEIYKRIVAELDENVPTQAKGTYQYVGLEAKNPYSLACIREAFRITPIASLMLPREVANPGGVRIAGHHIPQGVNVSMVSTTLHHNPKVWGPDHENYEPLRFLEGSPRYDPIYPGLLLHFGQGHRQCIGRNVAMMSIWKILVTLLKRYEFELVDPDEVLVMRDTSVSDKVGPFNVRVKLRKF